MFAEVFGFDVALEAATRRPLFRRASARRWRTPAFRPRALFERFNIEVLATTEGAARRAGRTTTRSAQSGWSGRVVTAYRPDAVVDPEHEDFATRWSASAT